MKKVVGITTGVVVIAVAGWLGATWYTGKRIESEEPARLTQLNEQLAKALASTGAGVTIDRLSYDRHFFSSDVRYGIKVTKLPGDEAPPEGTIEVVGHIEHGPFAKGAIARGQWLPKLAFIHTEIASNDVVKPLFELTKGASPLIADTIMSYNGDGVGTAQVPPMTYTEGEKSFSFSGMQLEGSFERATQRTVGTGKIDKVTMDVVDENGERVQPEISGLSMDVDSRMGQFGLAIGTSSAKIDSVLINIEQPVVAYDSGADIAEPDATAEPDTDTAAAATPAQPEADAATPDAAAAPEANSAAPDEQATIKKQVSLKDLGYTANVTEDSTNLNVEAGYSIGQIVVDGNDFGKGHATIKFERIDGKAAKALSDLYNDLIAEIASGKDDSSESGSDARVIEVVNQLVRVLAANPTLRVDPFVWETAKGQSNLDLVVELTKPEGLVAGKGLTGDIDKLAQQAVKLIDMKVSVSKPMVQDLATQYLQRTEGMDAEAAKKEAEDQVTSMAGMAEMFGIANTDGDKLVSTFHYADGKANLNGEEIPADQLFGALLSNVGSDDADGSDNTMLNSLDPAEIGEMISDVGYAYELGTSDYDTPVLRIDTGEEGAKSVEILFNDCESESSCSDMQLRATVETARPVPMRVFNEWNQNNRPTRAYWDADNKVAAMEMDVNAYGGVGKENVQYAVHTFLGNMMMFAETMKAAPGK